MTETQTLALDEGARSFSVLAMRVTQPIGTFWIASIPAKKLLEICHFDIRGIKKDSDFADFMGIQRELSESRLKEIRKYVQTVDATFPTGIVIAIDERCVEETPLKFGAEVESLALGNCAILKISNDMGEVSEGLDPILYRAIARVLDGQHRIAGLQEFPNLEFDLNVVVFVGLDVAMQASIFSVVNKAQTKVNKSLVYDLFSYEQTPSPEKTCHEVAVALDRIAGSPFSGMIKRLGVATEGRFGETLSQATFVKALLPYISRDVIADRDAARRKKSFPRPDVKIREKLILRSFFTDGRDKDLAQLILNYFVAVRAKWPDAWAKKGQGWILNKSTGYISFMRFFGLAYCHLSSPGEVTSTNEFSKLLERVTLDEDFFTSESVKRGTSGEVQIYNELVRQSGL
jgi:DGQHR domain-containing protein